MKNKAKNNTRRITTSEVSTELHKLMRHLGEFFTLDNGFAGHHSSQGNFARSYHLARATTHGEQIVKLLGSEKAAFRVVKGTLADIGFIPKILHLGRSSKKATESDIDAIIKLLIGEVICGPLTQTLIYDYSIFYGNREIFATFRGKENRALYARIDAEIIAVLNSTGLEGAADLVDPYKN